MNLRLIKTIIWFILSDAWAFVLTWLFLGDVWHSLYATIAIGSTMFVLYYWYESIWEKIYKRRSDGKEI